MVINKDISLVIYNEIFIIYRLIQTDLSSTVIPSILFTLSVFYMKIFKLSNDLNYSFLGIMILRLLKIFIYFMNFIITFTW
jgi:hypothetical protein